MADDERPGAGGRPDYVLRGTNGVIECWPDRVVVRREGGWRRLGTGYRPGERAIPYEQIRSVDIDWAGMLQPGAVTFTLLGEELPRRSPGAEVRDENAVRFRRRDNEIVREMRGFIDAHLGRPGAAAAAPGRDRLERLERLARLHAEGQLTDQEFEDEKQRLG